MPTCITSKPPSSRVSSSFHEHRAPSGLYRKLGKVGRNVAEQIARSKDNDLSRLIYALGIRHVGEKAAATLARYFRTMDKMLDAPLEALQTVPDVGPVVAASVRAFADEPHNRALVAKLGAAGVNMSTRQMEPDEAAPGPLREGVRPKGTLETLSREAAAAAVERLGGKVPAPWTEEVAPGVGADAAASGESPRLESRRQRGCIKANLMSGALAVAASAEAGTSGWAGGYGLALVRLELLRQPRLGEVPDG